MTLNVDIFNTRSCVIQSDLGVDNMGGILWYSNNAKGVLNLNDQSNHFTNINSLLPRTIHKQHDEIIKQYLDKGRTEFLYKIQQYWLVDHSNVLFEAQLYAKLYFDFNHMSILTYIKRQEDLKTVLLTTKGDIDSSGRTLIKTIGVNQVLISSSQHHSIFLTMPQLIPYFLQEFYSLPSFSIQVI